MVRTSSSYAKGQLLAVLVGALLMSCSINGANDTQVLVQAATGVSVSFNTSISYGSETLGVSDIPVSLTTVSNQTVTVKWSVTGGTATNGADYSMLPNGVPNGTLTFAPGEMLKTIRVATVRDNLVEGDETVILVLSAPVHATLGPRTTHTFTIYDSPPRNVSGDVWADVVLGQRDHTESTTNTVVPNHVF